MTTIAHTAEGWVVRDGEETVSPAFVSLIDARVWVDVQVENRREHEYAATEAYDAVDADDAA